MNETINFKNGENTYALTIMRFNNLICAYVNYTNETFNRSLNDAIRTFLKIELQTTLPIRVIWSKRV